MKTLNLTFDDRDFKRLAAGKATKDYTWEGYFLFLNNFYMENKHEQPDA